MVPVLKVNDILIVGDGNSFNDLKVGDIIVFHRPAGEDRVIVHRVAQIQNDFSGHRVIITKGDANSVSIPGTDFPIRENNFIGKVIYVIPIVGAIPKLLSPPVNYLIIAVIIIGLVCSKLITLKKKKAN
jgi:signal peptidase